MTTAKTTAERSSLLSVNQLRVAPWNARKTFDQASLAELAESIRQHGVLVKLIVRPLDVMADVMANPAAAANSTSAFEIVAGHRRFRAAQLASVKELPCEIRELTDDQAREIGLVDNLQRENVPAMEEAVAFSELLTRLGSIEAVASRVQKDQGYVAKRLKLCSVTLAVQDSLRHGLITVDHALLLAPHGADEQDANLKWCLDHQAGSKKPVDTVIEERVKAREEEARDVERYRSYHWEPQSVQKLKDHITDTSGTPLDRAPWDLDSDAMAEDAPPCNACPRNTKANAPLFGDLDIGQAKCTDSGCFKEKTETFVHIQMSKAKVLPGDSRDGVGSAALRVSWKATSVAPRMEIDKVTPVAGTAVNKVDSKPNLLQIFKQGQWIEAKKKSCEHVRAAVTVDWSDAGARGYMDHDDKPRKPGEIIQVCVEPKCKAHPKEYAKAKSAGAKREDPKVAEARDKKREEDARAETKVRVAVASLAIDALKVVPLDAVRVLALESAPKWGERERIANVVVPGFMKLLNTAKVGSPEFARAVAICAVSNLVANGYGNVDATRKEFVKSMRRLGYDASKAWEKPKAEKAAAPAQAKAAKTPAKKAAAKPAKKTAKKAGRK